MQDHSSKQPQRVLVEEFIEEDFAVSACEDHKFELPDSYWKVEVFKDIVGKETINAFGCEMSNVSTDVDEKKEGKEGYKVCDTLLFTVCVLPSSFIGRCLINRPRFTTLSVT